MPNAGGVQGAGNVAAVAGYPGQAVAAQGMAAGYNQYAQYYAGQAAAAASAGYAQAAYGGFAGYPGQQAQMPQGGQPQQGGDKNWVTH